MSCALRSISVLIFFSAYLHDSECFVPLQPPTFGLEKSATFSRSHVSKHQTTSSWQYKLASVTNGATETTQESSLEVVLFGVGDLRTRDHAGLVKAFEATTRNEQSRILPLFVYDEEIVANIPGAATHTLDTATILSSAIQDLSTQLQEDHGLTMQICTGSTIDCLKNIATHESAQCFDAIHIHVCDLGPADTSMGYNPFSILDKPENDFQAGGEKMKIMPWQCNLREEPWDQLSSLPKNFPNYEKEFSAAVLPPLDAPSKASKDMNFEPKLFSSKSKPQLETLVEMLMQDTPTTTTTRLEDAKNTGLFGSHWGGFHNAVCTETDALQCLDVFANQCEMDDEAFLASEWYQSRMYKNPHSLEHATLSWMSQEGTSSKNLLDGELMVRCLAAPLLMGCVSPRQLVQCGNVAHERKQSWWSNFVKSSNVLAEMAEAREWQRLFAASCIQNENGANGDEKELKFKYWRWHGFLCRYGVSKLLDDSISSESKSIDGIVLVHGFGASGSQWSKAISALRSNINKSQETSSNQSFKIAFAPDLVGFGQCEKPALTYTQYLWESFVSAFVQDVCVSKYNMDSFVYGGNSIGGYTSMAAAADDTVPSTASREDKLQVTGSGAPGTGRCSGVALMNSAGRILTQEEAEAISSEPAVAEKTAANGLPPCSPPPKPVSSLFGKALLAYLRPRIQEICVNLYPSNPDAVDEELCSGILRDSQDPGAIAVMISGSKLPPPRTANELLNANFGAAKEEAEVEGGKWTGTVLIAQGMKDPLNDATGRANMFQNLRSGIQLTPLDGGHCPHDELPEQMADAMTEWLSENKLGSKDSLRSNVAQKESVALQ